MFYNIRLLDDKNLNKKSELMNKHRHHHKLLVSKC